MKAAAQSRWIILVNLCPSVTEGFYLFQVGRPDRPGDSVNEAPHRTRETKRVRARLGSRRFVLSVGRTTSCGGVPMTPAS